jgi:hypothetical protein
MVAERLEVRLDSERRRKLGEVARLRGVSVSEAVREMIDEAHKEIDRATRIEAARRIGRLEIEDVPDPEELSRQLDTTHDLPDLY